MLEPQPTENIPFLLADSGILAVKCDVLESQTSVRMPTLQAVPAIFSTMQPIFEFCLPTKSDAVPTGRDSYRSGTRGSYLKLTDSGAALFA